MTADGPPPDAEMRPRTPTRRPKTARGRVEPTYDPPSAEERRAMERHLASLPLHSGARVTDDAELEMLLVRGEMSVPGLDYGAAVRWPEVSEARVALFEARVRADGSWPSLLVADGIAPRGLTELLASLGWSEGRETVLWTRRPVVVPHLDPMLRLEAVTTRSAAEHESLERRIFGLPASTAAGRTAGLVASLAAGTLRAYLVRSRGEPVAVCRLSLLEVLAGLYGIGVVADRRREGLGGLITAVAMRAGLASGRPLVWLSVEDGNDDARGLYEALGFQAAFGWGRWLAPPR